MTYTASIMADQDAMTEDQTAEVANLDIRTGDEIETLYRALANSSRKSRRQFESLMQRLRKVSNSRRQLIRSMADMIESRDAYTAGHTERITKYTEIILKSMKELGYYEDVLTDKFIDDVIGTAPLHDLGKNGIGEDILNKPGKLTEQEFAIMKKHTEIGSDKMDEILQAVPDSVFLAEAKNIVRYHHEKWDGSGYPEGLKGEEIPLSARVVAVADMFDALMSKRSYKEPFTFAEAMDVMNDESGSSFDPLVAEAFIMAEDEIRKIK